MTNISESSFKIPGMDSLPGSDATLRDIGRFIHYHDPTASFHKVWGDAYKDNARSLWQRLSHAFKDVAKADGPADELLMGMACDGALGPYLGEPESKKLEFLHWLLEGVRHQLKNRAQQHRV